MWAEEDACDKAKDDAAEKSGEGAGLGCNLIGIGMLYTGLEAERTFIEADFCLMGRIRAT